MSSSDSQEKSTISSDQMTSYYVFLGVFAALSCCGILFSMLIIAFNCKYRNHRQIKMSSPRLNVIGMVGAILLFLSTPLHQKAFDPSNRTERLDHTEVHNYDVSCKFYESFIWCVCMGFSLFYGSLVVKAYRVYQIFKIAGSKKLVIPDWHLFIVLFLILFIDAIILTSWHFMNPITFTTQSQFSNGYFFAWVIAQLCHKFILMSIGLFVSWKNRLVNFSFLVDSPSLIFITFITLVAMTIARCLLPMFSNIMIYCAIIQSILYITSFTLVISAHIIKIWNFLFHRDSFTSDSPCLTSQFAQKDYQHVCNFDSEFTDDNSYCRVHQRNQELLQELSALQEQNRSLRDKVQAMFKYDGKSCAIPEYYARIGSKSFSKTSEDCGSIARSNPDSGVEIPDILHESPQNLRPTALSGAGSPKSVHPCACRLDDYCSLKMKDSNNTKPIVAKNIEDYELEEGVSLNSFAGPTVPQSPQVDLAKSIAQTYGLNEEEDVRYVSQCLTLSLQKRVSWSNRSPSIVYRPRASTDGSCYTTPASEYFNNAKTGGKSWPIGEKSDLKSQTSQA